MRAATKFPWLRRHALRVLVVAGFALPALLAGTGGGGENRVLAPAPTLTLAGLLAYPRQLDAWIDDHFGWRAQLIGLNARLRYRLLREFPTVQVIEGRHGRLYLSAHQTKDAPYSAITNVCGPGPVYDGIAPAASAFNRMLDDLRGLGFARPQLLIVPSAPVIEHQDLPAWLGRRCVTERTPVAEVIASPLLAPATRAATFYPLAEMRMWKGDSALYPKTWFHWGGPALANVVDLSVARLRGAAPPYAAPLPLATEERLSDVSHLFNGLRLTSRIMFPDYAAAGMQTCFGSCFPEFGSGDAKLKDTSRISNPKAPIKRRLLILSDSFGSRIAGWYARYYFEVEQICGNDVPQLDGAEVRRVREMLLRDPAGTDVLVLYHDGAAIAKAFRRGMGPLHARAPG